MPSVVYPLMSSPCFDEQLQTGRSLVKLSESQTKQKAMGVWKKCWVE